MGFSGTRPHGCMQSVEEEELREKLRESEARAEAVLQGLEAARGEAVSFLPQLS